MIDKTTRQRIIALINKEVVPAMGCTEPMAVALAVAKSKEMVGTVPERIEARLSANILKNAMGVGIPGTGMIGLPIAIALGAIIGNSAYGLEVLKDITPTAIDEARRYVAANRIDIGLKEDISERNDVAAEHPDIVKELATELGDKLRGWEAPMPFVKATGKVVPMPDEVL